MLIVRVCLLAQILRTISSTTLNEDLPCQEFMKSLVPSGYSSEFSDHIIAGPPKEIFVSNGSSVDICAVAVNYCDCTLVIVDGSNEDCVYYPYGELLVATYTIINVTEDHKVRFVFKCNGSYEFSTPAKIWVKDDVVTPLPSPSSTDQDLLSSVTASGTSIRLESTVPTPDSTTPNTLDWTGFVSTSTPTTLLPSPSIDPGLPGPVIAGIIFVVVIILLALSVTGAIIVIGLWTDAPERVDFCPSGFWRSSTDGKKNIQAGSITYTVPDQVVILEEGTSTTEPFSNTSDIGLLSGENQSARDGANHQRATGQLGPMIITSEEPFGGGEGNELSPTDNIGTSSLMQYSKCTSVDAQGVLRRITSLPSSATVLLATTQSSYKLAPHPTTQTQTSTGTDTFCSSSESQVRNSAPTTTAVVEDEPVVSQSAKETVQNEPQAGSAH